MSSSCTDLLFMYIISFLVWFIGHEYDLNLGVFYCDASMRVLVVEIFWFLIDIACVLVTWGGEHSYKY